MVSLRLIRIGKLSAGRIKVVNPGLERVPNFLSDGMRWNFVVFVPFLGGAILDGRDEKNRQSILYIF
jgi:hypothetical protein